MATSLASLSKLSKIQLPGGASAYRLIDKDVREMIGLTTYTTGVKYDANQIIYYETGDCLYRVKSNITATENTSFEDIEEKLAATTITKEIQDRYDELVAQIIGGTHFIGRTTTTLTDGATTNPIVINGDEVTAQQGDIVIYNNGDIDVEFIFDGTKWNEFGTAGLLKALAFADTASGEYTKPTGEGSTTINVYELTGNNATATTVTGATDVEYVNGLSGTYVFNTNAIKEVAITDNGETGTAVVNGLTGTTVFNTDAIKAVEIVDNASTGTAVVNGLSGTTVFNTDAIKNVELTGTTEFVTSAINSASLTGTQTFVTSAIGSVELTSSATTNTVVTGLTGTTSFATYAINASVDDECLTFATVTNATFGVDTTTLGLSTTAAATNSVGITTTAASAATFGVTYTAAATGTFDVTTKNIKLSTTAASTATFDVTTKNLGLSTTAADTATFEVTTKHIHFTPSTTVTGVTVNTATDTVTVSPDTAPTV